ncbi:metallophosphoesterase [Marinobacterium arenosum]|uniref:metallophosphoesterase n=1 Tax=Marinobacterium arenosum TaxID=2862496 RepID=UPI001C95D50A|nr:metallophosphoesterase [Marinobacterium arenosum]MBY4678266.1 metallophosphoesterase [Marinobacterium arenosum]
MKIQLLSDLHIEFFGDAVERFHIEPTDAELIVLAGDIGVGTDGMQWAIEQAERLGRPILYVPGNHEYYFQDLPTNRRALRELSADSPVQLLDDDQWISQGVRFLGCTLWTDYRATRQRKKSLDAARRMMNDHRLIVNGERVFSPEDAEQLHQRSLAWLKDRLGEPFAGRTVVISHHGPSPLAQHPGFPMHAITGAFWSDLEYLMGAPIDLWLFGHTHMCLDETINGTRLVSNQQGYRRGLDQPWEVREYDPGFVLEL